jgi:hypothetical protein
MESMDYWRLCDELTVKQAALLIVDEDPSQNDNIENWDMARRPIGYEPAKTALIHAILRGDIQAKLVPLIDHDFNGVPCGDIPNSVDINNTILSVFSVKQFLKKRGFTKGFFFPPGEDESPDYLSKDNPYYAAKLAAAMGAWKAVSENPASLKGRTPKQAIEKWLREHAGEYGLTKEDGNPNEQGIEEIAKVANWKPSGGVAKTPGNDG